MGYSVKVEESFRSRGPHPSSPAQPEEDVKEFRAPVPPPTQSAEGLNKGGTACLGRAPDARGPAGRTLHPRPSLAMWGRLAGIHHVSPALKPDPHPLAAKARLLPRARWRSPACRYPALHAGAQGRRCHSRLGLPAVQLKSVWFQSTSEGKGLGSGPGSCTVVWSPPPGLQPHRCLVPCSGPHVVQKEGATMKTMPT